MFGVPEQTDSKGEVKYYLQVLTQPLVGAKYKIVGNAVVPNLEHQEKLIECKNAILSELINHKQLFKKPPTLEYLQAITPNWGCIVKDSAPQWNPYTVLQHNLSENVKDCYVDLKLVGLFISRSTISPRFETVFLENLPNTNVIDIEWSPNPIVPEVEEVSDIGQPSMGFIELKDPVAMLKAKLEAKQLVKAAFKSASEAKSEALKLAQKFANEFAVDDNESMFSEWLDESDNESGQESADEANES